MHRGPLSTLIQEYQEKEKEKVEKKPAVISTFIPKVTASIPKAEFIPINNKTEEEIIKPKSEIITDTMDNKENYEEENGQNGDHVVPPKPLPRASRTGSINDLLEETQAPRPVARPRTTNYTPVVTSVNPNAPISGGYKV